MTTFARIIELLTDIGMTAAVLYGAWLAKQGLDTWRRELHGKAEYEIARRLLRSIYEVRYTLSSLRSSLITSSESPLSIGRQGITMSAKRMDAYTLEIVYQNRMRRLDEPMARLRVELLEAEAIWEKRLSGADEAFRKVIQKLPISFARYLRARGGDESPTRERSELLQKIESVIWKDSFEKPEDDEFAQEVNTVVEEFEDLLRPYLRPKE